MEEFNEREFKRILKIISDEEFKYETSTNNMNLFIHELNSATLLGDYLIWLN